MASLTYSTRNEPTQGEWRLWRHWTVATALGELLGFGVPALAGAIAGVLGLAQGVMVIVLVCAGTLEGAVLGLAQSLVLRRYLPGVRRRDWVVATALAAALAWMIGMMPSSLSDVGSLNSVLLAAVGVVLASIFLLSIGGAQWWVLRRHVQHAGWWVVANAVAWPLGVGVPVVAISLAPDGTPLWAMIAIGLASGVVMGLVVGAITGLVLMQLLPTQLKS